MPPRQISLLTLALAIGVGIGSLYVKRFPERHRFRSSQYLDNLDLIISIEVYFLGEISSSPNNVMHSHFFGQCFDRFFFDMIVLGARSSIRDSLIRCATKSNNKTHRARTMAALNIMNAFFMVISSLFTLALFRLEIKTHYIFLL